MIPMLEIRNIVNGLEALTSVAYVLDDNDNLFEHGLDSFGSVQLMLALEEHFNVEFPDHLLNRRSFATLSAIRETVASIASETVA